MIINFSSIRVEKFAEHCVKILCSEVGFRNVRETQLSLIVNNCHNLITIVNVLKTYYPIKYYGQHGELDKTLQKNLNLELALYEISGKSSDEKRSLIEKVIKQHDNYVNECRSKERMEDFITQLVTDIEHVGKELKDFLDKTNDLYSIQKNELRRLIQDNSLYEDAIELLSSIYIKYLKRAISISKMGDKHEGIYSN